MNNRGPPMGRGFDGRGRGQFQPGRGRGFGPGRGPQMGRGGRGMMMGRGSPDNFHGGGRGMMMGGRGFNNGPPGRGFNNGPHGRGPPMMDGRGRGPMGRGPPMNGRGNNFRDHHPNNNMGPPMNNRGPMNRPPQPPPPNNRMMGPPMNGPGPMGHPNQRPPPPPPMMNGPPMGHPNQHMNQMQMNNQPPIGPPNNMMMGPPMGQGGGPPNMMQNGPTNMMGPPMNNQQGPGFPQQQMQMGPPIMQPPQFQQQQQQQPPPMQIQQRMNPGMIPPGQQMMQPQIMQAIPPNQVQQQQPPPQSIPQQQQSQIAQSQTATTSKGNPDTAWTEHKSPAGLSYYYNTVTGVSTYEKPAVLGGGDTSSQTSTKQSASVSSSSTSKWQTYTDESTGKKYYSDGVTTTWSKPDELIDDGNTTSSGSTKKQKRSSASSEDDRKTKKKKVDTSEYSNKAEALAAFKGLLLAKDIAPTTKWQDVVKTCSDDKRWEACTTMGERKQALAEYQTKRANELRDVKRQEKVRAKEAYQRLLTNVLPSSEVFTPGTSRFSDVRDLLSKDDRFYAVEDETTREELYYEFVEELRKKDERSKRNKIREAKENCLSFFKAKEEEGKLSFASTWSSFMTSLDDEEKNDVRFAISPNLIEKDRQVYFSDYVIELQNEEDEKRRRIRDARRRAEKEQRDAFHNRLSELAKDGAIAPDTRWRSMEDKLSSEPTYEPVNAQGRDVACDLFEDFVYDWREEYRRDKVILGRVWEFSKKDFVFDTNEDTNVLDDFGKMLLESSADHQDLYGEIRRMSTRENPLYLSSIALFFKELNEDKESGKKNADESSEDEGEIKEDEEEVSEKED